MSNSTKTSTPLLTAYQNWQGSFQEMVDTANSVLTSLGKAPSITPRITRHYQQIGTVSRGERRGKASRFGFNDLCSLVETKLLAQDSWPLRQVRSLQQCQDADYVTSLLQTSTLTTTEDTPPPQQELTRAEKALKAIASSATSPRAVCSATHPAMMPTTWAPSQAPTPDLDALIRRQEIMVRESQTLLRDLKALRSKNP